MEEASLLDITTKEITVIVGAIVAVMNILQLLFLVCLLHLADQFPAKHVLKKTVVTSVLPVSSTHPTTNKAGHDNAICSAMNMKFVAIYLANCLGYLTDRNVMSMFALALMLALLLSLIPCILLHALFGLPFKFCKKSKDIN